VSQQKPLPRAPPAAAQAVVPDAATQRTAQQALDQRAAPNAGVQAECTEINRLSRIAYASAFCREQIREKCRLAAVENALKQFQAFAADLCTGTGDAAAARSAIVHHHGNDLRKLEALIAAFERWYYERSAPRVVNMAQPAEWYPRARMMRRNFVFHCGPTNSGKTHAALEALAAAKSGVYCAPLKALASQVWRTLNERVPCDLLIGDERQFAGFAEHTSCTVEMTPIDFTVEVGVIDEIQLIEDPDRGWAWTRALLGLPAREIHLCGEARALAIVKRLLYEAKELKGLRVHEYGRLVPLEVESHDLHGDFRRLQSGDCLVTFSRKAVFTLAASVRAALPHATVRTIYGGLPFMVRERESDDFNEAVLRQDPANPAILVSTDAIAYGLNMSIRRIIFTATVKFDGRSRARLSPSTVMQVAGRAGRYGMPFDRGLVCGLRWREHQDLVEVMGQTGEVSRLQATTAITGAGLLPTAEILGTYVSLHRRQPGGEALRFDDLVARFASECRVTQLYFACDMERGLMPVARVVAEVNMTDDDRVVFCFAPVSVNGPNASELVRRYATMHAAGGPVKLLLDEQLTVVKQRLDNADGTIRDECLARLEDIYRLAEAYCWLAWRFRRTFTELDAGTQLKKETGSLIASILKE
jgi:ATP-dependent RNA helicase SUPV3L1/SUV3